MFKIVFTDVTAFGNFLSINEIDFVDVFFGENTVKFISNSTEVYTEYRMSVLRSASQEPLNCRIGKNFLKSVGQGDVVTVSCTGDNMVLSLYSGNGCLLYTCSFLRQVAASSSYADRVAAAENLGDIRTFNLDRFDGLYKIARLNGGIITAGSGVGAVTLKEAGAVYKEVDGFDTSFAVTSRALACLKKCNNDVGIVKDMLAAVNGGFTVFVQKARMETLDDYSVLSSGRFGAKYTAEINLHNLFRFLYKTKISAESVEIDTNICACIIGTGHCTYTIPVDLKNARTADGAVMEKLAIPVSVLLKVLNVLQLEVYSLRVMKNFIQFKAGGYTIVW